MPRRLLEQSFYETYGLSLTGVMGKTGRAAILSYRNSVLHFIPVFAKAEVVLHRNDFPRNDPPAFRTVKPYLQQATYLPDWAHAYREPDFGEHLLALVIHILPSIGPVEYLKIRGPREETERLYYSSLSQTLTLYERRLDMLRLMPAMPLGLPNRDLDTGDWTKPGAYALTDQTYARLLHEITKKQKYKYKYVVPPSLKQSILDYYAVPDAPITTKRNRKQWQRVQADLAQLRRMPVRSVIAGEGVE